MNETIDSRTSLLIGEEAVKTLKEKTVAIFGLGGVGGTAFESLVRAGVGHIYAVDRDVVAESNLNRQILFTADQVDAQKALCAFVRAKLIRQDTEVVPMNFSVSEETLKDKDFGKCEFLIDCVDDIKAKVALMKYSVEKDIPLIICLGMGNRLDPSKLKIVKLNQTSGDPLARSLRDKAKKEGLPLDRFTCVISEEEPLVKLPRPSSMMMVPSASGLLMSFYVIKRLTHCMEEK
ncbi:MAG: ThiF family adenylyltransferase [Bacilli bacterium]|nr:ThiF family adenylyltransferase [Bacilli bacterium]